MNEILEQALLYDFYGELLTEHQKHIYEQVVIEDMSLSEIASDEGISRQGVHDLVKRCNKSLQSYEDKLHLVEKFVKMKEKIEEMQSILEENQDLEFDRKQLIIDMKHISSEIIEEL